MSRFSTYVMPVIIGIVLLSLATQYWNTAVGGWEACNITYFIWNSIRGIRRDREESSLSRDAQRMRESLRHLKEE